MNTATPIDVLRENAERALEDALMRLGACRSAHAKAVEQLDQLMRYEQEYRQQLQDDITGLGVKAEKWINYQKFIASLYRVVAYHSQQVSVFQSRVDLAMKHWQQKKQRLNAFEILKARSDAARLLHENRTSQKQMNEFAQRLISRRAEQ